MNILNIIFVALSIFTVLSSLMVVFSKNPIHSILYLILTMFSLTGHYILLHAQFIAIINIIVYAGAIMVLFLFVLMLLNLQVDTEPQKSFIFKLLGVLVGGTTLVVCVFFYKFSLVPNSIMNSPIPDNFGFVKPLGHILFTKYLFPFELSSILFLAAIVGVVFIGNKTKHKI